MSDRMDITDRLQQAAINSTPHAEHLSPTTLYAQARAEILSLRAQLAAARDAALEEAANIVDIYMREGGFKALTAAERVRALKGPRP